MAVFKIGNYLHSYGRVPRNTLFLYLTHVATALISLFFFGIIARRLGVFNFGVFSYVYAFMTIAQTAGAFGLDMLMIREIAGDREKAMSTVGNTLILKIVFSSVVLLSVIPIVCFSDTGPVTRKILFMFLPYIVFSNVNLTLWYIGDGYQKMEYRGIFTVAYYACRTIGGVVLLNFVPSITALFFLLVVLEALFVAVSYLFASGCFGKISFEFNVEVLKRNVRFSFPFAVSSILLIFLMRMDILVLNSLKGEAAVGFYSPAQKLVGLLLLFSTAFTSAAYPAMSHSSKMVYDHGYGLFSRALKLTFLSGVFFASLFTIFAVPFVKMVFGNEYLVSAGVLRILAWMCPAYFSASLFWVLFAARNFQHWTTAVCLYGVFIGFGLNFYLVRKMSYLGSALAMVIFSFFLLALSLLIYHGNRKKLFNL